MNERYSTKKLLIDALFFLDVAASGRDLFDKAGYPGLYEEYIWSALYLVQLAEKSDDSSVICRNMDEAKGVDRAISLIMQVEERSRIMDIEH